MSDPPHESATNREPIQFHRSVIDHFRNHQAIAKIKDRHTQQISVPSLPCSILKAPAKAHNSRLQICVGNHGKGRDRASDVSVQIGVGTPPICSQESVDAIVRHRNWHDLDRIKHLSEDFVGLHYLTINIRDSWKIIVN